MRKLVEVNRSYLKELIEKYNRDKDANTLWWLAVYLLKALDEGESI